MDQAAYSRGLDQLSQLQHTFHVRKRPARPLVTVLVNRLVKKSGMAGDKRERYFRLLATSALLNREPMYSNWDRTKLKKKKVKS